MNRRGDVEIVINTRILERTIWLILVLALVALLWWRWDTGGARTDAASEERIATLEAQLAERDARITALEITQTPTPTPSKPNATNATPQVAPPTPAPVVSNTSASATSTGGHAIRWTQIGSYPATGKYKLESVEIIVESGKTTAELLSYSLCWSSIECERAVTRGNFTAKASDTTSYEIPLTIPTYVDITKGQRMRLVVFDTVTKVELFREEASIR